MKKKLNDFEGAEYQAIEDSIDAGKVLTKERTIQGAEKYGLCGTCQTFEFAESEFDVFCARCSTFKKNLSESRPIRKCNNYSKVGEMSIYDMKELAWLIDIKKDEDIIGFKK